MLGSLCAETMKPVSEEDKIWQLWNNIYIYILYVGIYYLAWCKNAKQHHSAIIYYTLGHVFMSTTKQEHQAWTRHLSTGPQRLWRQWWENRTYNRTLYINNVKKKYRQICQHCGKPHDQPITQGISCLHPFAWLPDNLYHTKRCSICRTK